MPMAETGPIFYSKTSHRGCKGIDTYLSHLFWKGVTYNSILCTVKYNLNTFVHALWQLQNRAPHLWEVDKLSSGQDKETHESDLSRSKWDHQNGPCILRLHLPYDMFYESKQGKNIE